MTERTLGFFLQEEKITMLKGGSILSVLVVLTVTKIVASNRCLTMLEGKYMSGLISGGPYPLRAGGKGKTNRRINTLTEVNPKRVIHLDGQSLNINFEVSRRVTQRLSTRIMKIFLTEVLGYTGVSIFEIDDEFRADETFSRLSDEASYNGHRT